jgi:hypothetical protein
MYIFTKMITRYVVLRRHIVYKTMLYRVSVYTIRGMDIPYVLFLTTCFGPMGPSSGTLGLTITYFFSCYSPYTGQCLHIGSALYVWFI